MRRQLGTGKEFSLSRSQDAAIALVREFMIRDEVGLELRNRRTPVLLFTGPRGAGKTALLARLEGALRVPHAYLDCAGPLDDPRDMLSWLAFDLSRRSLYGRLQFPRLITGQMVADAGLALEPDPKIARRRVSDLLADREGTRAALEEFGNVILRGGTQALLASTAAAMGTDTTAAMADYVGARATRLLVGGLAKTSRGRSALLGKGQDWYELQAREPDQDSLDVLIKLSRKAAGARAGQTEQARGDARDVAELLWAAFLADLRHGFRGRGAVDWTRNAFRGRDAVDPTLNCVILLDNADAAPGRAFLDELLAARALCGEPDPLTVVATSRGDLAERVRADAGLTPLADASYQHYLSRGEAALAGAWYPVLLPPLSWAQTRDMTGALQPPVPDGPAVTTAVHAFTGGHPGATRTLLAALGERREASANLLAILAGPEPGRLADGGRTAADALLDDLLRSLSPMAAEDLVTCAAARHQHAARRMAAESDLTEQRGGDPSIFAAEFWCDRPAGGPAALQPLLRRLLLRRLAARPQDARAGWAAVNDWLRDRGTETGDEETELYHMLALAHEGDPLGVRQVAEALAGKLKAADEWLRTVARVTAAPSRLDLTREPRHQVSALTDGISPREMPLFAIARLVAVSWLGADPASAPHWRQLLRDMASELDQIAPYGSDHVLDVLREKAQRYRDTAAGGSWRDVEDLWVARVTPCEQETRRTTA